MIRVLAGRAEFTSGDTVTLEAAMRRDGSRFFPADGYNLIFSAKLNREDTDEEAVIQKFTGTGIEVIDDKAYVELVNVDTETQQDVMLYCDIRAINLSTGDRHKVAEWELTLNRPVTQGSVPSIPIHTTNPSAFAGVVPPLELDAPPVNGSAESITSSTTLTEASGSTTCPTLYRQVDLVNGKPKYVNDGYIEAEFPSNPFGWRCYYDGSAWIVEYQGLGAFTFYYASSNENVATPDLVVTWNTTTGTGTPDFSLAPSVAGTQADYLGQPAIVTIGEEKTTYLCTQLDPVQWDGPLGNEAISSTDISDSTPAGRAILTAADAAAQRAAMELENVDNTSDADKPISLATQNALDGTIGILSRSDLDTLIDSNIASKFWGYSTGPTHLIKDKFPFHSTESGITLHGLNLSKSALGSGVNGMTFVAEDSSLVTVEVWLKTAPSQSNANVGFYISPEANHGTVTAGSTSIPVTSTLTKHTFTFTPTAGAEYQIHFVTGSPQVALLAGGLKASQASYAITWMGSGFSRVSVDPKVISGSRHPRITEKGIFASSGASVSFATDATAMAIDAESQIYSDYPVYASIDVWLNGSYYTTVPFTRATMQRKSVTLPSGLKMVTIVNGSQSKPGSSVLGTNVRAIYLPKTSRFSWIEPRKNQRRICVLGDSICSGADASSPSRGAFGLIHHGGIAYVQNESYGWNTLLQTVADTFIRVASAATPTDIYIALGTNDYGLSTQSASNFGTQYGAFLDSIHAAFPHAKIWAQTPTLRTVETANTFGDALGAYRAQISTAVSTRAWASLVDGTAMLTLADMSDGLHPSTIGHAKYALEIEKSLGL